MSDLDAAAPAALQALLERMDIRRYDGLPDALPEPVRSAFRACPRHRFVDRYRLPGQDPVHDVRSGDAAGHLAAIYQDEALRHVGADGAALPSTNSVPSFVLRLLALLDIRPGQRVLEIGSGSGWLLGVIAQLVGPGGRAIGVEILADLAARSRGFLAGTGVANAEVIAGDGSLGWAAGAPYDRVMVTTGLWDVPAALFDQVAPGGLLLVPIQVRGYGEDVLLLRRVGAGFVSEATATAYFVRAAGLAGGPAGAPRDLDAVPLLADLAATGRIRRQALDPLCPDSFMRRTHDFRSFLSRTEPRFCAFGPERQPGSDVVLTGFGILDESRLSAAIWQPDAVTAYGGPEAMADLMAAYRDWTDLLMPSVTAFQAELLPAAAAEPGPWTERRGHSALVWRLRPGRPRASDLGGGS